MSQNTTEPKEGITMAFKSGDRVSFNEPGEGGELHVGTVAHTAGEHVTIIEDGAARNEWTVDVARVEAE